MDAGLRRSFLYHRAPYGDPLGRAFHYRMEDYLLRLKRQRSKDDCGLCCVAMIAGRPYREVLWLAMEELGYSREGPHLTTINNLRRLLALYDIKASKLRSFRGFSRIGETAVLLCNYEPPRTKGHWIVFERRPSGARILNPSRRVKYPIHSQLSRLKVAYVVELTKMVGTVRA